MRSKLGKFKTIYKFVFVVFLIHYKLRMGFVNIFFRLSQYIQEVFLVNTAPRL